MSSKSSSKRLSDILELEYSQRMKAKQQEKLTKKILSKMTPLELSLIRYFPACNNNLKVLNRWSKMLEKRAIRHYIEYSLDDSVAEEDLSWYSCTGRWSGSACSEEYQRLCPHFLSPWCPISDWDSITIPVQGRSTAFHL